MNLLAVNSELPNTKMTSMLIFLGILTVASALSPLRIRECRNLAVKQNFDPQTFFKGNWFLTHIKRSPEETDVTNVCQGSTNEELQDGKIEHIIFSYSDVRKPEIIYTNCTGNVINKQGNVVFQCTLISPEKTRHFQLEVTIVETDYDNFAVYYACEKDGGRFTADALLVLNRKENGEPTDPRIADTLRRNGLILSELLSRKSVNCKSPPGI